MKLKSLLTMLILSLSICISASAESSSCITESPSNITYYGALISGTFNTTNNEEYGFELWEESGSVIKIIAGNGTYSGAYSKEIILIDNTQFSYRTYIKSADNNYIYGTTVTFETGIRKEESVAKVNLDFSDIILEESSLQQTPNKFLINNLILNNSDALHLVAGENFNGYENIKAVGDDNILNNHFL